MKHLRISAAAALAFVLAVLALAACNGTAGGDILAQAKANEPLLFQQGCAAVSYADGAFAAAAPALVVAGKLSADSVAKERAIFASVQATCANPPADLAMAGLALVGQASAIYLLLAAPGA